MHLIEPILYQMSSVANPQRKFMFIFILLTTLTYLLGRIKCEYCNGRTVGVFLFYQEPIDALKSCGSGLPFLSVRILRLQPFFPRSVGFLPTASRAKDAFTIAPSRLCHSHAIPSMSSYSIRPLFHNFSNKPAASQSRKY